METIKFKGQDIIGLVTSLSYQEEISNEYLLGNAIATQVNITINNKDGLIKDILDYPFSIDDKIYMAYEKPERYTGKMELVLYDNMLRFNAEYQTGLVYPTTITEQLLEIQSLTGVSICTTDLSSDVLKKEVNWYDSSGLIREFIGFIAECDGKNAYIGKDNKVHFKKLGSNNYDLSYSNNYELIESVDISCVLWSNGVTEPLSKGIDDKNTLLLNSDNLYVSQDDVNRIYELYKGLKFYSFKSFKSLGFMEATDSFTYGDLKFIALNVKRTVNGGLARDSLEVDGEFTTKDVSKITDALSDSQKIKKVEARLNNDETKINLTAQQVEKNVKNISDLEIGLDGIKSDVSKSIESIYKFESGSNNIFSNCHKPLIKTSDEINTKFINDMPLDINKSELKGKAICISTSIEVINGIVGQLSNRIGVEFDVGYADGTKKTYSVYWYLGQFDLQYLLQTSTADHEERIWAHFKLEDKEISSVSNLKMIIDLNAERAVVANPKVEFGTRPTGFDFDLGYVRDNITTIEENYTQINQTVNDLSLKAVSQEKEITTIKGNVSEVTTRIQSAEIKLQPTNILLAVNEQIGANGQLYTTKFVLDKSGVHISGGGLDIVNNSGTKVFYADANGNLIINNLKAVNGSFSGRITASVITGSTFSITSSDGCTLSIDSNGLVLNAKATSNIFGYQGGILTIGTKKSILDSMFSPITYQEGNSSGKLWTIPLANNVSKIEFGTVMDHRIYFTTLFGRFYVECQSG